MKMSHKDALHILGLKSEDVLIIPEAAHGLIVTTYRQASSKYHPDRNPAGLEMMKLINAAYAALEDFLKNGVFDRTVKAETTADTENYGEEINKALNAIVNLGLTIEICGAWIWVSGDTRPHREILKTSGFKWAPKKAMWHFRPIDYKSFNRGKWDMDKIRATHGSQVIKNRSHQQLSERA